MLRLNVILYSNVCCRSWAIGVREKVMAVCLLVAEKLGPAANIGRYLHDHMDKHVH